MNNFPVLRIAGLGNFYDTRRCNKAYPVSFGDRLSFSQESGLMFRFAASKFAGRFRHLAGNGISHVSIVNPFPKFVYINRFHYHASYSIQNVTTGTSSSCCLTNSLQSCKICWKKRTVPLTAPQPSIASYCLYFSGLDYSSSGPCRIWGITSTHNPLFSSFLHGRPVFPVPGDGTGCEQNLWQPHLNRIYTY